MTPADPLEPRYLNVRGRRLLVGQIWYDDASRARLDPLFVPIHNARLGPFFEAAVIRDAIAGGWHRGTDLAGIFSWRFSEKFPLDGRALVSLLERAPTAEVYSFFGALAPGNIWKIADRKHRGILHAAQLLFDRLGLDQRADALVAPPIYQHHFIATAAAYERFVIEMLGPALSAMGRDDDPELRTALDVDSGYRHPRYGVELTRRVFGLDWLPLHPFVAERLFSTWLALRPELTVHPLWHGRFVAEEDVRHEPELRGEG
jgi:hypothetical protein